MIITRRWLNERLDLSNVSNSDISKAFNSLGFEVEQSLDYSKLNTKLIIAKVLESTPVPDTHLRWNRVDLGNNKINEIICGAPNVDKGQFVLVACPGETISNGLTLTEREIRGYKSQGMICSLLEVGFDTSCQTELELDSIYNIHSNKDDLDKMLGQELPCLDDYLWDVDLTLNRSDALASYQLLKEIGNYFKLQPKVQFANVITTRDIVKTMIKVDEKISKDVNSVAVNEINILETRGLLNTSDELWIKKNGFKTSLDIINNLLTMATIRTGQPVIAYDTHKVNGLVSLEMIKVEDKQLLALVEGKNIITIIGENTKEEYAVTNETKRITTVYLNFTPQIMRAQQKQLNVSNAYLQRYTKPLSPELSLLADADFLTLLSEYKILANASSVKVIKTPNVDENYLTRKTTLTKVKEFLGMEISFAEIEKLFLYLDFKVELSSNDELIFTIDKNRTDIVGENDLCEEIARLYGYDNIQEKPPIMTAKTSEKHLQNKLQTNITKYLIGKGFNNIKTYSLVSNEEQEKWNLFNIKNPVKLLSPLSKLHEVYRTSLSKSIIDVAIYNSTIGNKNLSLFEVGDVYNLDCLRQRQLAVLTNASDKYEYIKGILDSILDLHQIDSTDIEIKNNSKIIDEIHLYINGEIIYKNKMIGYIYKLNPKFEIENKIENIYVIELNLDELYKLANLNIIAQEISKFQMSTRDITIEVPNNMQYAKIVSSLKARVNNLIKITFVSSYEDEELKSQNKSAITIKAEFNNLDHQLTEKEINVSYDQIVANINQLALRVR